MRALFYSPKGTGHVNPTLPLVRGLVERGHEAFSTSDYNPGAPFFRTLLPTTAALLPRLLDEARELKPDVIVFDSLPREALSPARIAADVASERAVISRERDGSRRKTSDVRWFGARTPCD